MDAVLTWAAENDNGTYAWHATLIGLSALNTALLAQLWSDFNGKGYHAKKMLALCTPYVFTCAFRGCFVNNYISRRVVVDSAFSNIVLARGMATVAEICFACQVSTALAVLHRDVHGGGPLWRLATALTLLAAAANTSSNVCVATKNNFYCAAENSCWGFLSLFWAGWAACTLSALPEPTKTPASANTMRFLRGTCGLGFAAFLFIALIDVPMYIRRYKDEDPSTYLGLADGLKEAVTMRVASNSWSHWQEEVCWLTAYFSFAVWGSLFMAAAPPRFGRGRDPSSAGRRRGRGGAAAGRRPGTGRRRGAEYRTRDDVCTQQRRLY